MTGHSITGILSAAFVLIPVAAMAQAPSKAQQDAIRSNCRSDYMANCSSVKPGGREALECLMKNKANVSGGCQNALNAVAAPVPAAAKPDPKPEPKPEPKAAEPAAAPATAPAAAAPSSPEAPKAPPTTAAKPAPKAAKAPARPATPPPAEAAAPSPGLAAAPPADGTPARPMRIGEAIVIRRFCSNDFKVLCKGVPIGQGRAVQCLVDNRGALSPGCRQAMADTGH